MVSLMWEEVLIKSSKKNEAYKSAEEVEAITAWRNQKKPSL